MQLIVSLDGKGVGVVWIVASRNSWYLPADVGLVAFPTDVDLGCFGGENKPHPSRRASGLHTCLALSDEGQDLCGPH